MSSGARSHTAPTSDRQPVGLPRLAEMKAAGEPIAMITAYDYPSAQVAEEAGVDIVLVGDSAAMVVLGYPGTEPVSMDEMIMLGKAVRRGLTTPLMVGDMPMGSYEASNELAVDNAQRLVKETGCQVVKLEAGGTSVERARAIVSSGIPVMGHVGLTPQTATALGGYKAQGKTAQAAIKLSEDALALQAVGCFAIVFEAVPAAVTEAIVEKLEIPTIGIGAGPGDLGPGARLPRPARDHHRADGEIRQALRRHPRPDGRRRQPVRRGGPLRPLPGARPRLRGRAGRARRAAAVPGPDMKRLRAGDLPGVNLFWGPLGRPPAKNTLRYCGSASPGRRRRSSPAECPWVTTELAPITQRSPIVTPLVTTQLTPNQQLEPIRTGPLEVKPWRVTGVSGSSKRCSASPMKQPLANIVWSPIRTSPWAAIIVLRLRKHSSPISIRASGASVSQQPGSSSVPSPIVRRPSSSASSTSPSTGWRMKKPPRAAWRAIRQRRRGGGCAHTSAASPTTASNRASRPPH